jgi:3-oxoacyl-[acyl-carrier-protein] synthase III
MSNFDYIQEILQIEKEKFEIILPDYGNIASCCI